MVLVDDFEDGDLSEYSIGGVGVAEIQGEVVHEGDHAIHLSVPTSGASGGVAESFSGLGGYPAAGDTFEFWGRVDDDRCELHFWFAHQDTSESNRYEIRFDNRGNEFEVTRYVDGDFSVIASTGHSWATGSWYRGEVDWEVDGTITARLYDAGGNRLQEIGGTDTTFSDGGIAWATAGSSGPGRHAYGDLARITSRSGSPGDRAIVDDFEDGNVDEYEPRYARPPLAEATFDAVSGSLVGDGSRMLRAHRPDGEGQNPRIQSVSGLDYYPSRGDTIEFYTQYNHTQHTPAFYFGVQNVDETDLYYVQYDSRDDVNPQNPDSLVLNRRVGGTTTELAKTSAPFSSHANEPLRCVIEWADPIRATFYDSSDDLIAEVSASDDTFSEGGIGFGIRGHFLRSDTVYWDQVTAIPGDGQVPEEPDRVSAKATTLTLLPGYNENSRDPDGDDLNSAIPDLSILDESFIGDNRLKLPKTLDEAIDATRGPFPEYPGLDTKAYRLMNQIELSFETEDGKTISDWSTAQVRINNEEDPISSDGEWQPSYILVEGELEHGEDNPVRELIERPDYDWFNGKDKLFGDPRGWHDQVLEIDVNKIKLENADGEDVEGVRASIIRGARDTFIVKMRQQILQMDSLERLAFYKEFGLVDDVFGVPVDPSAIIGIEWGPPYFYTFIDLIVLADDSTITRVWDASRYPKHYLYVGNDQVDENDFEEGEEWTRNDHPALNTRFNQTNQEQQYGNRTPYAPHRPRQYEEDFDKVAAPPGDRSPRAHGPHPVMGKVQAGSLLSESDLLGNDEIVEPHFPWN